MKKHLLGASAILALALFGGALPAAAACDPATHAVQYLASKQLADGSIDGSVNETADFVLGAASDGIDPKTLKSSAANSPYDFLLADLGGPKKSLADANVLGKLVQAVVAAHLDPHSFGGVNLVDSLINGKTPGATPKPYYSASTGVFLDDLSGGQNQGFTQANAVLGLVAAADPGLPVPAKAIGELKSLQSTAGANKGGWSAFGFFDTNTTSMALMALAASGNKPATNASAYADAFTFIHGFQDPASGGFSSGGGSSDPQSDGLVIQALTGAGEDPAGPKWSNAKGSAVADILTFQDPVSGGFTFDHVQDTNAFTTAGPVTGLRRAPFPVLGAYVAGAALPAGGCPATVSGVQAAASTPPSLPAAGHPASQPGSPVQGSVLASIGVAVLASLAVRPVARRRLRARR